jgi:hypothetical protein
MREFWFEEVREEPVYLLATMTAGEMLRLKLREPRGWPAEFSRGDLS